jgi:hypothetical protein
MRELVVMRLDDMDRRHPSQDNSRVCSKCGAQVGIYPSGQKVLKNDPSYVIICSHCVDMSTNNINVHLAPGSLEEAFESIRKERE